MPGRKKSEEYKREMAQLEQMHESDLTAKQKRQLEAYHLKEMSWKQRLRFFWDYYKWTLLVALIAVLAVRQGISIYQQSLKKNLLAMGVMDAMITADEGAERLCGDLAAYLGSGDPYEEVTIDTALTSEDSVTAITKLVALTSTGLTDILFMNADSWPKLSEGDSFWDWRDVLGEQYDLYDWMFDEEGRLDLSQSEVYRSYGLTSYEPVYCGLIYSSEKLEAAKKMVEFFAGQ